MKVVFKPCAKCGSMDYDKFQVDEGTFDTEDTIVIVEPDACDQCTILKTEYQDQIYH